MANLNKTSSLNLFLNEAIYIRRQSITEHLQIRKGLLNQILTLNAV